MATPEISMEQGIQSSSSNKNSEATIDDDKSQESIERLPNLIISEILKRVPVMRSVVNSMSVSKEWLALIKNPNFARTLFPNTSVCPLLVMNDFRTFRTTMFLVEGDNIFYLYPQNAQAKLTSKIVFDIPYREPCIHRSGYPFFGRYHFDMVLSSCRGLVCWLKLCDKYYAIIICNPITGEYIMINDDDGPQFLSLIFVGVGFNSKIKRFMLLRVSGRIIYDVNGEIDMINWNIELFTLGIGPPWRFVQNISENVALFMHTEISQTIYTNGLIYWTHHGKQRVFSFNFEEEVFDIIPMPNIDDSMAGVTNTWGRNNIGLGLLGSSVCISLTSVHDGHAELWTLTYSDGKSAWSKILNVNTVRAHIRQWDLPSKNCYYRPLKYLDNGDILMQHFDDYFIIYDPLSRTEKSYFKITRANARLSDLKAISYTPSLVPLRDALMDDNVKIFTRHTRLEQRRAAATGASQ